MPTLGIDPGGKSTGIVVIHGARVLASTVIERPGGTSPTLADWSLYRSRVVSVVSQAFVTFAPVVVVGIETVTSPNPHRGMTNPAGIIDTARVFGWLEMVVPGYVPIAPDGHGSAPLSTYPDALRGPTEQKGAGWRRHARSAYDVARTAHTLAKLEANELSPADAAATTHIR